MCPSAGLYLSRSCAPPASPALKMPVPPPPDNSGPPCLGAVGGDPRGIGPGRPPAARVERGAPVGDPQQYQGSVLGCGQTLGREGRGPEEDARLDARLLQVVLEGVNVGAPDRRLPPQAADERAPLLRAAAHYAFQLKEIAPLGVRECGAPVDAELAD